MSYHWDRYWAPRGTDISVANNGFLYDPGSFMNNLLVRFESLKDERCLVLLGEPGIGKTTELNKEYQNTLDHLKNTCDVAIKKDLRSYSTDTGVIQNIFEDKCFLEWKNGSYKLYLFIDSLDECRLRVKSLLTLLADKLGDIEKTQINRLYLRIACRTAAWGDPLEGKLVELFQSQTKTEKKLPVYELAPLTKKNVEIAARCAGINSDDFIEDIITVNAQPLAIKPVTLEFLVHMFKRENKLSNNKIELYHNGCLHLVTESNVSRKAARDVETLNPVKRFLLASKLAALVKFCNKPSLRIELTPYDADEATIFIDQITEHSETIGNEEVIFNRKNIEEVLDTGLFSGRGDKAFGFAHETYSEYLAAHYIASKHFGLDQINDLLFEQVDDGLELFPQLHETAAWLASMCDDVFDKIASRAPEVLINSNSFIKNKDKLPALVASYLERLKQIRINEWHHDFQMIPFDGLKDLIRPFIAEKSTAPSARVAAMRLLSNYQAPELHEELIGVVKDASENGHCRSVAAHILAEWNKPELAMKLKEILSADIEGDEDDELKGVLLETLWPKYLSPEELFASLSWVKRKNLVGTYGYFLGYILPQTLSPESLEAALAWLFAHDVRSHDEHYDFEAINDRIILLALQQLKNENIAKQLTIIVYERLKKSYSLIFKANDEFNSLFLENRETRERWFRCIMKHALVRDEENRHHDLILNEMCQLLDDDIPWLIDELSKSDGKKHAMQAYIIARIFKQETSKHIDLIITSCQKISKLREQFGWWLNEVELGSEIASQMREIYGKPQNIKPKPDIDGELKHIFSEIIKLINECENNQVGSFWKLAHYLTIRPGKNRIVAFDQEPNLSSSYFWTDLSPSAKETILRMCKIYIDTVSPEENNRIAYAGYKAFRYLKKNAPEVYEAIDCATWERWALYLISFPIPPMPQEDEEHIALIKSVYEKSAETPKTEIKKHIIDTNGKDSNSLYLLKEIEPFIDDKLSQLIIETIEPEQIKTRIWEEAVELLLKVRPAEVIRHYHMVVSDLSKCLVYDKARLVILMRIFAVFDSGKYWEFIQKVRDASVEINDLYIAELATYFNYRSLQISAFTVEQKKRLYIEILQKFSYDTDPEHPSGAWTPTLRERVGDFRDSLLRAIEQEGTEEAISCLKLIASTFPQYAWLQYVLARAKRETARKAWEPLSIREFLKMASTPHARIVRDVDQLQSIILWALSEIEKDLHKGTAKTRMFWNEDKGGCWPKDENAFSDQLKDLLDRALAKSNIILNREVQITKGEETDIKVDAIVIDSKGKVTNALTVIVEVKGCWHSELKTAMKSQLVDRYLLNNGLTHGIYLIGWFLCDSWNDSDIRKKKTPNLLITDVRRVFGKQAADLSSKDVHIAGVVFDARLND